MRRHSGNERHKFREWRVTQDSSDVSHIAQASPPADTTPSGTSRNARTLRERTKSRTKNLARQSAPSRSSLRKSVCSAWATRAGAVRTARCALEATRLGPSRASTRHRRHVELLSRAPHQRRSAARAGIPRRSQPVVVRRTQVRTSLHFVRPLAGPRGPHGQAFALQFLELAVSRSLPRLS